MSSEARRVILPVQPRPKINSPQRACREDPRQCSVGIREVRLIEAVGVSRGHSLELAVTWIADKMVKASPAAFVGA